MSDDAVSVVDENPEGLVMLCGLCEKCYEADFEDFDGTIYVYFNKTHYKVVFECEGGADDSDHDYMEEWSWDNPDGPYPNEFFEFAKMFKESKKKAENG